MPMVKNSLIAGAFAACFTLFCVVGQICADDDKHLDLLISLGVFSLFFAFFLLLSGSGRRVLFAVQHVLYWITARFAPKRLLTFARNHEKLALFLVLVIAWLPYLILFFPGIVMYDTTWELFQTQGSGALTMGRAHLADTTAAFTDHKPLVHMLLVGLLFNLGKTICSQTLGIFLVTLLQYIAMAWSFAFLLKYCCTVSGLRGVQLVGLLFFALFPTFPMYAVSPFNDCIALAAFIVWAIYFAEVIRTKGASLQSGKMIILLVIWGAIASLMKKPNAFIIIACAVVLVVFERKHIAAILVQGFAPAFICLFLVPAIVYNPLNVLPGDKGEFLGTFFQQTVAYALNHGGGIPDSDREVIDKILDLDEAVNHYNPITFDKTKYYYRNSETTEELIDYFIIWARQGADDPLCYLSAVAHLQYPWIYPSQTMDYYNIDYEALKKSVASLNADYTHGKALIVRDSLNYQALPSLEGPRSTILGFLLKLENIPGFNFLLSIALYATWIPLILSFIALTTRKRDVSLAALAPMYASMAVLSVSPIVMCRYALPVFALTPLAFAITLSGKKQGEIPRELNAQCAKRDS